MYMCCDIVCMLCVVCVMCCVCVTFVLCVLCGVSVVCVQGRHGTKMQRPILDIWTVICHCGQGRHFTNPGTMVGEGIHFN